VAGSILHAIASDKTGIYSVAGDGALTISEIATQLGKRCVVMPASLIGAALAVHKRLHLTQYGPEQVDFLRYRPVLDHRRLKQEFGCVPQEPHPSVRFLACQQKSREMKGAWHCVIFAIRSPSSPEQQADWIVTPPRWPACLPICKREE
jgi:hypothetical protein